MYEEDSLLLDLEGGSGKVSIDIDTPDGKIDLEEGLKEEDDKGGGGGGGGERRQESLTEVDADENDSSLYSSIEIGKVSGELILRVRIFVNNVVIMLDDTSILNIECNKRRKLVAV